MNVLKQMLVQGCGIGFLYEAAVQEDLQQGRLRIIELEDFAEDHDITFLWRKGSIFAPRYRRIYGELCQNEQIF